MVGLDLDLPPRPADAHDAQSCTGGSGEGQLMLMMRGWVPTQMMLMMLMMHGGSGSRPAAKVG